MVIEVELISKELMKPSSLTPYNLSKLAFSFIDQNQVPLSLPYVLFYEKSKIPNQEKCSLLLKQSLSEVLTIFYPLAGRINNYCYINCNDHGALFIEAKADCKLSDVLQTRNQYYNHNKKFVLMQLDHKGVQYGSLFQITYFNCGGLAVSFAMPHMLGDALSQLSFLNVWGVVARSRDTSRVEIPTFVSTSIFPPGNIHEFDISQWAIFKDNVVTKPFVFDDFVISALEDKYNTIDNGERFSLAQALCVFIFSRITATSFISQAKDKRHMVINSVNVRELLDPPLLKQSFGNLLWPATTMIDNMCKEDEIARKIKDSIRDVNAELLNKIQNGELNFTKETFIESLKGDDEIVRYSFTSLCNFPIYDVDFGWGKPQWITTSGMDFDNFIICLDTRQGNGIEAWISLTEEDMAKFENDEQLLSHLSFSPNGNSNFNSRL